MARVLTIARRILGGGWFEYECLLCGASWESDANEILARVKCANTDHQISV
jgi:hypothetical protein